MNGRNELVSPQLAVMISSVALHYCLGEHGFHVWALEAACVAYSSSKCFHRELYLKYRTLSILHLHTE